MKLLNPRKLKYLPNGLAYLLGRSSVHGPPMQVMIEPTNVCNIKCVYCPQSEPQSHFVNGRGFMPLERYRDLIEKISRRWPGRIINLIRDGEPTLHPEIVEFVRIASDNGHRPQFSSNMSKMTPQLARDLIGAGICLVKTDFSHDPEIYERLRAGAQWDRVRDGICAFLEAMRETGQPVGRALIFNIIEISTHDKPAAESAPAVEKLREVFREYRGLFNAFPTHFHNALGESSENLSQARDFRRANYNLCHHPFLELVIDFKGDAVGCCRDLRGELPLGNVFECRDIHREIWNGPAMRELRRHLICKRPEAVGICSRCDLPYGSSYAGSGVFRKIIQFVRH